MPARARLGWLGSVLIALLMAASPVRADPRKRSLPDYDGRPEPTTAGHVLLWIPRIVLSPLYVVSEFVLRRPLGFLISEAERAHVPQFLYDLFLFGPDHRAGLVPIAFIDFGFYPSVGLFFFWKDFVPGQELRVRGATWGSAWLAGSVSDSIQLDSRTELSFAFRGVRRPDYQYFGIGSSTVESDVSRYGASRVEFGAQLEAKLGGLSKFAAGAGVRRVHFHRGGFRGHPTLDDRIANGQVESPPGYANGYSVVYNHVSLAIDSRRARPESGSGVRVELRAEQLSELAPADGSGFMHYGGTAGGFWDLGASSRVLSLSFAADFVDPLRAGQPVPFTELAAIGGGEAMRGFPPGRLYGRSSAVATLHYRWPIWIWLDGSLQFAVGNVFDAHLAGFAPELLRLSGAIGIESVGSPDSSFELLLGAGSETFAHGTQLTSLRVILGTNHGF